MEADIHQLALTERTATGEELWVCPTCERRVLVTWQPDFRRVVLARGDAAVAHQGTTGPASLASVSVTGTPGEPELRWLRRSGIEWHGIAGPDARSA